MTVEASEVTAMHDAAPNSAQRGPERVSRLRRTLIDPNPEIPR